MTSSAVIRRVAAKLLNVAKCVHYDGQKQTKLTSFLSEINCSDYMTYTYADICASTDNAVALTAGRNQHVLLFISV